MRRRCTNVQISSSQGAKSQVKLGTHILTSERVAVKAGASVHEPEASQDCNPHTVTCRNLIPEVSFCRLATVLRRRPNPEYLPSSLAAQILEKERIVEVADVERVAREARTGVAWAVTKSQRPIALR